MEFNIYNVQGQKRTIEGQTLEQGDKCIYIKDADRRITWWLNPNAVAFIEYKVEEPKTKLVVAK